MKNRKTIRELANEFPQMWDYYYSWRNTENPELEKDIDEVLSSLGYKLVAEDAEYAGAYNDIKGYLNCEVELL